MTQGPLKVFVTGQSVSLPREAKSGPGHKGTRTSTLLLRPKEETQLITAKSTMPMIYLSSSVLATLSLTGM